MAETEDTMAEDIRMQGILSHNYIFNHCTYIVASRPLQVQDMNTHNHLLPNSSLTTGIDICVNLSVLPTHRPKYLT